MFYIEYISKFIIPQWLMWNDFRNIFYILVNHYEVAYLITIYNIADQNQLHPATIIK